MTNNKVGLENDGGRFVKKHPAIINDSRSVSSKSISNYRPNPMNNTN